MRYYIQRHSHRIIRAIVVFSVILGLALGVKYFIANRGEIGGVDEHNSATTLSDTSPASVISRVLAVGNVSWGDHLHDVSESSPLKAAYPFSGLNTFSRNEYDAWIASLSCGLSTNSTADGSCSDSYLGEAKKWFDVFALSSTQTSGGSSITQTKASLKNSDLQFVGNKDLATLSDLCDVIVLPARYKLGDGSFKIASLPLAMCSFDITNGAPDIRQLDEVSKFAKFLPTWVYVTTGETTAVAQNELQKSVFKGFIDNGADMVLGVNPSIVQGAESYKGKLILYSLGNFMYAGSASDAEQHQSVSLKAQISTATDANMLSWVQLSSQCKGANDDCLNLAKSKGLARPTYAYSLSIVPADNFKDSITMTSSGIWEEQALKRLDWETVLPTLKNTVQ